MNPPAFQFYPKQLLADDKYMLMDWDARGMHVHFMCIAWQQQEVGTLPNDDVMLQKWAGSPADWPRLKEQIFRAWKLREDGVWIQEGLQREHLKQNNFRESRKKSAEVRWGKKEQQKPEEKTNAHAMHTHSTRNALQSSSSTSESNTGKFKKPTIEEVKLQAAKMGLPDNEAEGFFNYYESNGWKVGKNAMKSWQSAMSNWRKNWQERGGVSSRPFGQAPAKAPSFFDSL